MSDLSEPSEPSVAATPDPAPAPAPEPAPAPTPAVELPAAPPPPADPGRIALVSIDIGPAVRCFSPPSLAIHERDQCIVDVEGLNEFGTVVQLQEYCPKEDVSRLPRLIRRATLKDQTREKETLLMGKQATEACRKIVAKYELPMRLVNVRYSFDRQQLGVLFSSETRVDFRTMVRDLSHDLNVRVRLRQIGVRDEAGIIGALGPCGRMTCCCTWLRQFDSINVRMARTQRISMNPTAISGMCGRLKCCLRYENDQYRDMDRELPRDGAKVQSPDGIGFVVDKNILTRRIRVELEDRRVLDYDADELSRA
jgi:cell fate regulator YaaT (PSP1 superfamily)